MFNPLQIIKKNDQSEDTYPKLPRKNNRRQQKSKPVTKAVETQTRGDTRSRHQNFKQKDEILTK